MTLDASLRASYEQTTYFVDLPSGRLAIRIGQDHPELDRFLRARHAANWCFLTAWNPMSQKLAPEQNARRQLELEQMVKQAGWPAWPGEGIGDAGDWPPEPSLLIAGIALSAARTLARRFRQAAFVFAELDQPARLQVP